MRGEGALLVDSREQPVVSPLLPRDVVARAIASHIRERGPVFLSLRHLNPEFIEEHFAAIAQQLSAWGLDLGRDLLPVAPAAHYCMGGVRTDTKGHTDVPGLFAAGEAACTGAQGANRLASNSLLECLVFGQRAALAALTGPKEKAAHWLEKPLPVEPQSHSQISFTPAQQKPSHTLAVGDLGVRLDRDLGVVRDGADLLALANDLPLPETPDAEPGEVIAGLATRAALLRNESRGAHYRSDAPQTDPAWQGRIVWRRGQSRQFEEVSF